MLYLYFLYFLLNFIIIIYLLMKLNPMNKRKLDNINTFELYHWKRLYYKAMVLNSIKVDNNTNKHYKWRKWNSFNN